MQEDIQSHYLHKKIKKEFIRNLSVQNLELIDSPPPLKIWPRPDLLPAMTGGYLSKYVQNNVYDTKEWQVKFWNDLIIVHWIQRNSRKLKTLVQNHVSEIHSKINTLSLSYYLENENPANLKTQGQKL